MPLAVSEMLISMEDYRLVLEKRAADYAMIDPTWVGGISQTLKITDLAQACNLPVMMHDCTGPVTLLAGVHVGIAWANVAWQETVRRNMRVVYPELITHNPRIETGRVWAPDAPGFGVDPGDLCGLIALLSSESGSGICGQSIVVDGGLLHPLASPGFQLELRNSSSTLSSPVTNGSTTGRVSAVPVRLTSRCT